MKKTALFIFMLLMVAGIAQAATTRDTLKNESKKWGSFWAREGERSGLKESTSSWGNLFTNINPGKFFKDQQDSYNARKGQGMAK